MGTELMVDRSKLSAWWDLRSDAEQELLKGSTDTYPLGPEVTKLLFDTRCPALPVGASWREQDGYSFNMPTELSDLIDEQ
jgi:hypothetical protein